jgi:ribulose-phosphate 3-epimerase
MMVNPEKYIQQFYDAGADIITVHAEATEDAPAVLRQIRDLGAASGIAINPDTPVSKIAAAVPHADLALVMSVHAGFGGQSFIESVLKKFAELRALPAGEDLILEIDGGINVDTIGLATEHGAQLLVAGSAVFKQENYATAIENLMSQVKCLK